MCRQAHNPDDPRHFGLTEWPRPVRMVPNQTQDDHRTAPLGPLGKRIAGRIGPQRGAGPPPRRGCVARSTTRRHRASARRRPSATSAPAQRDLGAHAQPPVRDAHSQLPCAHVDVAMPPLRHTPGGDIPLLGLSSIFDHLFDLPELPPERRRTGRLLRARSSPAAAGGHRTTGMLAGWHHGRCGTRRNRPAAARANRCRSRA